MTSDILILYLKSKGIKEYIPQPAKQCLFLSKEWFDIFTVNNGGKIFEYNDKVRIVFSPFTDNDIIVLLNGKVMYATNDADFFIENIDVIIEMIMLPNYYIVKKQTEFIYNNGAIMSPAPIIEYPLIDGISDVEFNLN